jgi:hypothetical protein
MSASAPWTSAHRRRDRDRLAPVMALHPKVPKDIALAPVAAEIDLNLQALRDKSPHELDTELQLQLDGPSRENTRNAAPSACSRPPCGSSTGTAGTPRSATTELS